MSEFLFFFNWCRNDNLDDMSCLDMYISIHSLVVNYSACDSEVVVEEIGLGLTTM